MNALSATPSPSDLRWLAHPVRPFPSTNPLQPLLFHASRTPLPSGPAYLLGDASRTSPARRPYGGPVARWSPARIRTAAGPSATHRSTRRPPHPGQT